MKSVNIKKLNKALEMLQKAQQIVDDVANDDENFRYSSNANFRWSRIDAAVSILKTEMDNIK